MLTKFGKVRKGDWPGISSLITPNALTFGDDLTEKRAPLIMPTPIYRQIGFAEIAPNLLLATLTAVAVAIPIGERSTDLAPRVPPKIQVQAEPQEPSPLQRGIIGTIPTEPSAANLLGPQQHYAVTFEHPPNLLRKLLPDFSPVGDASSDSASIVKYAVQADNWSSQLTTGIPSAAAIPIPIGRQVGDSSPPKYAVQAQQYPTLIRVTLPDFAPVGIQLHDHETKTKYEVIALATPNLTQTTLTPLADALPIGQQASDSASTIYTRETPQVDDVQSLLGLNPPPIPVPPVTPGFVGTGGGGASYRCPSGWVWDAKINACRKLRLVEQPHRHLKQLLDEIGADILYGELTQPAASAETQAKAAKLVKPFSDDKKVAVPDAQAIDWAALERDAKRTASLVKLWLAQQHEQEILDEDDEFLFFQ